MKFSNAIEEFNVWRKLKVKQINGFDLDLRQFCIFVKNKDIEQVNIHDITEWLGWYKELNFQTWTVVKKSMALRKFFEYYKRRNYDVIDYWLIPLPKKDFNMPRVCTQDSYNALLSVIPENTTAYYHIRNRCLINLLWDTGVRIGELMALDTTDIDLENSSIIIKTEKSRGMRPFRRIPFSKETDKSLRKWLRCRAHIAIDFPLPEPDALFIGLKARSIGKSKGKRLDRSAAGEIFRKYSNKAGLPYVNAHSLRHHFGADMAKKGFNNSLISEALGHSQLASSYQYTQINNQDLEEALRHRLD